MKEGRMVEDEQTTDWETERAQSEWLIEWLIDVPCFVREVEPLLKGGIQLLLQSKDTCILALIEWIDKGRKEDE